MSDKARSRGNQGAGFGLSICQSVTRMQHAVIEVVSEEYEGTTIQVIFESNYPKGGGIHE